MEQKPACMFNRPWRKQCKESMSDIKMAFDLLDEVWDVTLHLNTPEIRGNIVTVIPRADSRQAVLTQLFNKTVNRSFWLKPADSYPVSMETAASSMVARWRFSVLLKGTSQGVCLTELHPSFDPADCSTPPDVNHCILSQHTHLHVLCQHFLGALKLDFSLSQGHFTKQKIKRLKPRSSA